MNGADKGIDDMTVRIAPSQAGNAGGRNGRPNHTGIVCKVEDGYAYTVEGYSGGRCVISRCGARYYEVSGHGMIR